MPLDMSYNVMSISLACSRRDKLVRSSIESFNLVIILPGSILMPEEVFKRLHMAYILLTYHGLLRQINELLLLLLMMILANNASKLVLDGFFLSTKMIRAKDACEKQLIDARLRLEA